MHLAAKSFLSPNYIKDAKIFTTQCTFIQKKIHQSLPNQQISHRSNCIFLTISQEYISKVCHSRYFCQPDFTKVRPKLATSAASALTQFYHTNYTNLLFSIVIQRNKMLIIPITRMTTSISSEAKNLRIGKRS